jgi:hypothetical protein
VLETLHETQKRLSVAERYALFVHIIHRSALAAQIRFPKTDGRYTMPPAVWWNGECEDAKRVKLKAFRVFMKNGIVENYDKYKEAELSFQGLCHRKKTESWRRFCSTLNFQTRLSDVWRMANKIFRNPRSRVRNCGGWMPQFVSKIAPPFGPGLLKCKMDHRKDLSGWQEKLRWRSLKRF